MSAERIIRQKRKKKEIKLDRKESMSWCCETCIDKTNHLYFVIDFKEVYVLLHSIRKSLNL